MCWDDSILFLLTTLDGQDYAYNRFDEHAQQNDICIAVKFSTIEKCQYRHFSQWEWNDNTYKHETIMFFILYLKKRFAKQDHRKKKIQSKTLRKIIENKKYKAIYNQFLHVNFFLLLFNIL